MIQLWYITGLWGAACGCQTCHALSVILANFIGYLRRIILNFYILIRPSVYRNRAFFLVLSALEVTFHLRQCKIDSLHYITVSEILFMFGIKKDSDRPTVAIGAELGKQSSVRIVNDMIIGRKHQDQHPDCVPILEYDAAATEFDWHETWGTLM